MQGTGESFVGFFQDDDDDIDNLDQLAAEVIVRTESSNASINELRQVNQKFMDSLQGYLDCRERMDATYDAFDELHIIAKSTINIIPEPSSEGIKLESGEFNPKYQQQNVNGNPVQNIRELYEAARIACPLFENSVRALVKDLNVSDDDDDDVKIDFPGLKGINRATEKARNDYSTRVPGPPESWLHDIVRGSVGFSSPQDLLLFVDTLMASHNDCMVVIDSKNRFKTPTLTGYRDWNLRVRIDTRKGFYHICELQIHCRPIKNMDDELGSHMYYEFFRSYFVGGEGSLESRLEDLRMINATGAKLDAASLDEFVSNVTDLERLERLADLFEDQICEYSWDSKLRCSILRRTLLAQHPISNGDAKLAECFSNLGKAIYKLGNYDDAIVLHKKALNIRFEAFGEMHKSVANSVTNIANCLRRKGKYAEAVALHKKALEIRRSEQEANTQMWQLHSNI